MSSSTLHEVKGPGLSVADGLCAVDIGATKTVVTYSSGGRLRVVDRFPTASEPEVAADSVIAASRKVPGLKSVGIGCPGPLNPHIGVIVSPPNLKQWWGFELADYLKKRLGVPVAIENDANLGALGEGVYGSAQGVGSLFYLTLSTGIGSGYIVDGKIVDGLGAIAGEVFAIDPGVFFGRPTGETLLELASGPGLVRTARRRLASGRKSSLNPESLDPPALLAAADAQDAVATEVVEASQNAIGGLLITVICAVAPEVVVLAGGLCTESRWFVDPVRERVEKWLHIETLAKTPIRRAELWDAAVLYGAAELARTAAE